MDVKWTLNLYQILKPFFRVTAVEYKLIFKELLKFAYIKGKP